MIGLLGRKIGMTQTADPSGNLVPATVLKVGPVTITKICRKDKEGYSAVQVGFEDAKEKRLNRSVIKDFNKKKIGLKRYLKEYRLEDNEKADAFKLGQVMSVDFFEPGDFVDVRGRTIGKGFQGAIKRWSQSRGPESHGSMYHRRTGSIGQSAWPSRTFKGHHMPGHMGDRNRTVQNLLVIKVLKDEGALLVRGSVPGSDQSLLTIQKSFKRKKIDLNSLAVVRVAEKKGKKPVRKAAKKN
jgi:large subunit ribosomal protein L3